MNAKILAISHLRIRVSPTFASESKLAGSAGMESSTDLVSTATTPVGIPPSLQKGRVFFSAVIYKLPFGVCSSLSPRFSVLLGDSPGSAHHHTLSPWLHDLHEGTLVKKATLPGTLWSCMQRW